MFSHLFPYKWFLKDGYPSKGIPKHGLKVFGTFICGGGSTMGYKLAGYDHLGGVEIDPNVADIYKTNHNPKYLYVEDLRKFNQRDDLPEELYGIDLLDGSPPCSTFSMAGSREAAWGKEKKFREGQSEQVLDDLVFEYIKTIEKLNPRVCLLENVKGIIQGNAKWFSKEIVKRLEAIGYNVQVFLLNAASMGVPQKRERVFFIGHKKELNFPRLKLNFNEKPILFKEVSGELGEKISSTQKKIWDLRKENDLHLGDTLKRNGQKENMFNTKYLFKNRVCNTITANCKNIEYDNPNYLSDYKLKKIGSYPMDYAFKNIKPSYLIGMSVPPVMTAQIAYAIYLQWFKIKGGKSENG